MKATTQAPSKPNVHVEMTWDEAAALCEYLGEQSPNGPTYDLFYVLDDIVVAGKATSTHITKRG